MLWLLRREILLIGQAASHERWKPVGSGLESTNPSPSPLALTSISHIPVPVPQPTLMVPGKPSDWMHSLRRAIRRCFESAADKWGSQRVPFPLLDGEILCWVERFYTWHLGILNANYIQEHSRRIPGTFLLFTFLISNLFCVFWKNL